MAGACSLNGGGGISDPSGRSLKGFEPSTFCMASSAGGNDA
jgi:hypothetical protein